MVEGWQKTSEYRHMGGGGLNFSKKRYMIFERFLLKSQKTSQNNFLKVGTDTGSFFTKCFILNF